MAKPLKENEILEHLKMLADWIRVKHPSDYFELVVVGGAAMALEGFKDQTTDIDVIRPEVLPEHRRAKGRFACRPERHEV